MTRADVKAARIAVLDWGSGTYRREIRSLPELATAVDDKEFGELLLALDIMCYRDKGRWYGEPLLEKLKAHKQPTPVLTSKESLPVLS